MFRARLRQAEIVPNSVSVSFVNRYRSPQNDYRAGAKVSIASVKHEAEVTASENNMSELCVCVLMGFGREGKHSTPCSVRNLFTVCLS